MKKIINNSLIMGVLLVLLVTTPLNMNAEDTKINSEEMTELNEMATNVNLPAKISDAFEDRNIARAIAYGIFGHESYTESEITLEQLQSIEEIRFYFTSDYFDLTELVKYGGFPNLKKIYTMTGDDYAYINSFSIFTNENFPVLEILNMQVISEEEDQTLPDIRLSNLRILNVGNWNLKAKNINLPNFSDLPNLEYIGLNGLYKNLPNFTNMPKLGKLVFQTMAKDQLSFSGFDNLPLLEEILIVGSEELNTNNQLNMPEMNLPNLKILRIENIGLISGSTLDNMPKLEKVTLSENKIESFSKINSTSITSLILMNNQLIEVPAINEDNIIGELYLDNNKIVDINNFINYKNIQIVSFSQNEITNADVFVNEFPKLISVNLQFNHIESRPSQIEYYSKMGAIIEQTISGEVSVTKGENYQLNLPIIAQQYNDLTEMFSEYMTVSIELDGEKIDIDLNEILEIPTADLEIGSHQLKININLSLYDTTINGVAADYIIQVSDKITEEVPGDDTTENNGIMIEQNLPTTGEYIKELILMSGILLTLSTLILFKNKMKKL